jgi:hypothetical protein
MLYKVRPFQLFLLPRWPAASSGFDSFQLEGDALQISLAINNSSLFSSWSFAPLISDVRFYLFSFQSWNALKVYRCVNFRAHDLAKWAASHLVF